MMFLNCQKPGLIKDPYIYKPDSIMLDLEDAVAENQKDAARYSLYHALQEIDYRGVETGPCSHMALTLHLERSLFRQSVSPGRSRARCRLLRQNSSRM